MVFPKVYFFSALLAGVVGGILTMLTLKILEAGPREQTRVEVENGRETGEGQIRIGVQESTKLEQEHDERYGLNQVAQHPGNGLRKHAEAEAKVKRVTPNPGRVCSSLNQKS
ncbi:unnamed protein product [Porites lobata]|uniref:Uncharacterized protein n=1 Tax=Porites lobata TaxID=104759 RepID=A0ABN8RAA8_9CNID|nr:unnamed protein product [Porites lobata]